MSHMKGRSNLTVDSAGRDLVLNELFLLSFGHSVQESLVTERFTVFHQTCFSHLMCQIVNILAFCFHAPFLCDADQLFRIFYLIVSVFFRAVQSMTDLTSVIGMCSCSACSEFQEVSSYDTMSVASADTSRSLGCDTARSHRTDTAADTLLSKLAVRSLVLHTELPGICAYLGAGFQQPVSGSFKFFHCS